MVSKRLTNLIICYCFSCGRRDDIRNAPETYANIFWHVVCVCVCAAHMNCYQRQWFLTNARDDNKRLRALSMKSLRLCFTRYLFIYFFFCCANKTPRNHKIIRNHCSAGENWHLETNWQTHGHARTRSTVVHRFHIKYYIDDENKHPIILGEQRSSPQW